MIPLRDDNKYGDNKIFATYLLIAINIFVFLFFQYLDDNPINNDSFTQSYSLLPIEVFTGKDIVIKGFFAQSPSPVYLTLISSMFLHGGWMHLLGNMFFLFLFGDNLEAVMGSVRFVLFYLLCGILAGLFNVGLIVLFDQNQYVLNLGASGAISGIVGGYMMLFPRNNLYMFPILGISIHTRAFVWGAMWITTQLLGCINLIFDHENGVGYGAHLGGAIAGFFLAKFFLMKEKNKSEASEAKSEK